MQKVAWATITVNSERSMPNTWVNVLLRATPVTIPGRAIGRMTRKEIVSRPKKRCRATASDDRQDDEEGDRLAAEEAVPGDGQRGERPQHQGDRGGGEPDLDRGPESVACRAFDRLR